MVSGESVFMDNTTGTVIAIPTKISIRSTMMCLCLLNMEVMSSSHMLELWSLSLRVLLRVN